MCNRNRDCIWNWLQKDEKIIAKWRLGKKREEKNTKRDRKGIQTITHTYFVWFLCWSKCGKVSKSSAKQTMCVHVAGFPDAFVVRLWTGSWGQILPEPFQLLVFSQEVTCLKVFFPDVGSPSSLFFGICVLRFPGFVRLWATSGSISDILFLA